MKIRKAYKYKLKTNIDIHNKLLQFSGCCRFVWNKAWSMNEKRLEEKQSLIWYQEMAWFLTLWKQSEEFSFLKEAPSQALQQTLKSLERAIKDGFDRKQPLKRMPRYKKKGLHDSFLCPQGFKIVGNRIFLPKVGWLGFFKSRELAGVAKNVIVTRKGEHWFVSIQVEKEIPEPIHQGLRKAVGIDVGIARFATLSDGSYLEPLSSFRKLEKKLAREQRKLAKKTKFSSNWKKQKHKIAKIHIKIANARKDYLHKASTTISKNHGVVVLEDLQIRDMSKAAKGDLENPGKNVKAKSGLNKSILDQGWSEFRRMLEYKQFWAGGELIAVPPHYTSQTCPECSNVSKDNRKNQSTFACECGYKGNADHVAAKNILAVGLDRSSLWRKGVSLSMKQEPARNREGVSLQAV